jgi:hypothetical protein
MVILICEFSHVLRINMNTDRLVFIQQMMIEIASSPPHPPMIKVAIHLPYLIPLAAILRNALPSGKRGYA